MLPRGLPVGVVGQGARRRLARGADSDAAPIDFVQILLFKDFSQLAPPQALAPDVLPPTATGAPIATPSAAVARTPPGRRPARRRGGAGAKPGRSGALMQPRTVQPPSPSTGW